LIREGVLSQDDADRLRAHYGAVEPRVYRAHSRVGQRDAYIAVRVRRGFAVIEELYIEDRPIAKYVREQLADEAATR
jgi:hypothetical protein